jgi:GNAT superfamily N-acetyltransferase
LITIRQLDSDDACRQREPLIDLLRDAVAGGASLGFLLPLGRAEAESYWGSVVDAVRAKRRLLLVALAHQRVIGSVQLDLETRANGRHRAEIMKLSPHRRQGVGRKLMSAVLALARDARRSLLLLDMRAGSRAPNRQRPEAAGAARPPGRSTPPPMRPALCR